MRTSGPGCSQCTYFVKGPIVCRVRKFNSNLLTIFWIKSIQTAAAQYAFNGQLWSMRVYLSVGLSKPKIRRTCHTSQNSEGWTWNTVHPDQYRCVNDRWNINSASYFVEIEDNLRFVTVDSLDSWRLTFQLIGIVNWMSGWNVNIHNGHSTDCWTQPSSRQHINAH